MAPVSKVLTHVETTDMVGKAMELDTQPLATGGSSTQLPVVGLCSDPLPAVPEEEPTSSVDPGSEVSEDVQSQRSIGEEELNPASIDLRLPHIAHIQGLRSRPELEFVEVLLLDWLPDRERWAVQVFLDNDVCLWTGDFLEEKAFNPGPKPKRPMSTSAIPRSCV